MALKRIIHPSACDPMTPVKSWWEASAKPMRHNPQPLATSLECDVTIIGAGFAGLNAALELAQAGQKVCVLEAGHIGWGASGRNGGFCANPGTKMSWREIASKYGVDQARALNNIQKQAIEQVRHFLANVDQKPHGSQRNAELCLAHSPAQLKSLDTDVSDLKEILGVETHVLRKQDLTEMGANSPAFSGGMIMPWGFSLHPLNYLRNLADAAIDAGVSLHPFSEVQTVKLSDQAHIVTTKQTEVRANHVIFATNGYSAEDLPPQMAGKLMPATSNILVTRPITKDEQAAQGWTTDLMSYDTRNILHYFRLLPDGRMMFGGRGAISSTPKAQAGFCRELRRQFEEIFPAWQDVETAYEWAGHLCLNRKKALYFGPLEGFSTVWSASGYHGSGVAMASWSGKTLAQMLLGQKTQAGLPEIITKPPSRFPFAFLRQQYLRLAYVYYGLQDRR